MSEMTDLFIPYSEEAEASVLGSILINPEKYFDVSQLLSGSDFYIHKNRWVWEAYSAIIERGGEIDVQTVAAELDAKGHLAELGGKIFLYDLTSKAPMAMHAVSYAQIVQEKSQRRALMDAAQTILDSAQDTKVDLGQVISKAEQKIFNVSEKSDRKEIVPINTVLSDVYDKIRMLYQRSDEVVGVPSGFPDLDKLIGGFQKSDLIIVAGRPGMGKTGFMLSVLKNAALNHKKRIAMFSLEMSNEQLAQRLISQQTGINSQKLRTGKLSDDDLAFFVEAVDTLGDAEIYLDDTPAITPMQLRSKCRRLHMEHHLDMIIIDYLQLMSGGNGNENRTQEVSFISRSLKMIAKELDIPVLTAAQLSRGVERRGADSEPMLSDLRESGSLEQDADIVMFLHKPASEDGDEDGNPDELVKLLVRKHRHGPIGDIDLLFRKNQAQFVNATMDYGKMES